MNENKGVLAIVVLVVLLACCVCAAALAGVFYFTRTVSTPIGPLLTEVFEIPTATSAPVIITTPIPTPLPGAGDTLQALEAEELPYNDLRELAMRLKGIPDIPETVGDKNNDWPLGTELEFIASNTDTNENFRVTARLFGKTENVYIFAGNDVGVDEAEAQEVAEDFQNNIYPTNREFFGSEWNPGIDGDPHIYILYVRGLGFGIGGYDSSADGYSNLAHEASNEKEIFFINADTASLKDRFTLAHEFQHLILGNQDRNEETFLNEGASVLAEYLNGARNLGYDSAFLSNPDIQLNSNDQSYEMYGAGFLFQAYFLDRFGSDATKTLIADQNNGVRSIESTLASLGLTDPATGQPVSLTDFFADWVIANYLGDASIGDGRYGYDTYQEAPKVLSPTGEISDCPAQQQATVHQFGADYIEIQCAGAITINFTGSQQVKVVPAEPHSGRYAFWGNRGDKSDTSLTREFDLSGLSSATLNYWTWYDIEEDYDYAYVEVSTDGGETFTILESPSCTTENPSGNSLGCGYTHFSGGGPEWIEESVDLSDYAGQKVLVRFEYITDDAVNQPGWLVDDISIPELEYSEDFESSDGDWDGQGFVRIDNFLPQLFVVQAIRRGATTTVERVALDAANTGSLTLDLAGGETVTLVVSGATQFTTEVASYQFEVK